MSDLSWLNPTPHAIAVYASSSPSPVATQHSLPSGRYPLLGPDFHRLDRTSLRLAHSLDYLIGAGEQRRWHPEAKRPRGVEVDQQLELGRLQDRKVGRLGTLEDTRGIEPDLAASISEVGSVAHQPAGFDKNALRIGCRNRVAYRQNGKLHAPRSVESASCDKQRVDFLAREALKGCVDLAASGGLESQNLQSDR